MTIGQETALPARKHSEPLSYKGARETSSCVAHRHNALAKYSKEACMNAFTDALTKHSLGQQQQESEQLQQQQQQ